MTPPSPSNPPRPTPGPPPAAGRSFGPLLVLAGTLSLTVGAAYFVGRTVGLEEKIRFAVAARTVVDAVDARLRAHVDVLRGGTGLFAAEGGAGVSHDQF